MKWNFILILCIALVACTKSDNEVDINERPVVGIEKAKCLWFDAEANFELFSSKENICFYLDKTKEVGFNQIVVDVRPIYGHVLYKKTNIKQLTKVGSIHCERDWDYLEFFIQEAKKRDLKVTVSTGTFTAGVPSTREGLVYESNDWDGKTVMQYTPDGMLDIKDDPSKVAVFLNPLLPEVQEYVLSYITEIVTNYDIDGYALDYCRFLDLESDFSEASRAAFEQYIGEEVKTFPQDIYRYIGNEVVLGRHGRQWIEFRAMIIHDFVKKVKETIKTIKPDVKLEYWAASWHHALFPRGQNWGSKNYDPSISYPKWFTSNYKNAGFAEHLDVFMNGAYLPYVYGPDNKESIEYALENGKRIIDDECNMYGSIWANNSDKFGDAVHMCLTKTKGVVVFDIVQVIGYDLWDDVKMAIERYEAEQE